MKKIFIVTGESSGDRLASKVINNLNKLNPNIEYLSVGGENLKKLGIKSIYDLKEITYLGFTNVIFNIFKIKKKINETVEAIENFQPDILFTVDSPDFTLRVAEKVKKNNPNVKTIHYVAPQVWIWRESRVKKIKAIGYPGITIVHNPNKCISKTLGDPKMIATKTKSRVIGDFRLTDMKAGGQGAPLAPYFHEYISLKEKPFINILNLGGFANWTFKSGNKLMAYDTGPANYLIDLISNKFAMPILIS